MVNDNYRIDSHKLIYHVARVSDWLDGKDIYPIYMEVSPSGACNHRCIFCSVDYLEYKKQFLDTNIMRQQLPEMGRLGVKSIMYAGEGEPFLHKNLPELICLTMKSGIDVAITTNGVLMTPSKSEIILEATEWIKVSCNAGSPKTYAEIHGTSQGDFTKVIENLKAAVEIRKQRKLKCTLGMQIILLPQNVQEVTKLARIASDIGLDYLVVKPYTRHQENRHDREVDYQKYSYLAEELSLFCTERFQVVFRADAMSKWDKQMRAGNRCLALPFWAYIDSGGNVRGCQGHLVDKRFLYGCLGEESFQEIWEGEIRRKAVNWLKKNYDTSSCKVNCRMDGVNKYLSELQEPVSHVNFI
jgi:MoaA/NifB/PqqE/SkfB family radical SAM enzyme